MKSLLLISSPGKLHHHIVALQVSEGTAVRKLEAATQKVSKLDAHILRLEQKLDEKDQTLYHSKVEARNKAKFLKRTIQELRRQYSGALPLMKQERFAATMRSLQDDKMKLEKELGQARSERELAEDKLAELELQHEHLQELMATLKDNRGAAKVTEWHSKMGEIKLKDLKLNRTADRLQVRQLHGVVARNVPNPTHCPTRQLLGLVARNVPSPIRQLRGVVAQNVPTPIRQLLGVVAQNVPNPTHCPTRHLLGVVA